MNYFMISSSPLTHCQVVERGLDLKLRTEKARYCLKWGTINVVLLAALLFDISNKCRSTNSFWWYVEYGLAAIMALSVFACFLKYFLCIYHTDSIHGEQLGIMDVYIAF